MSDNIFDPCPDCGLAKRYHGFACRKSKAKPKEDAIVTEKQKRRRDMKALKTAMMYTHIRGVRANCSHELPEHERLRQRALWNFMEETFRAELEMLSSQNRER